MHREGNLTRLILIIAFAAALDTDAWAQNHTPVYSSSLELVHLTVTVRDERGRLVSDLNRDDFKVVEDGRVREIQLFARAVEPGEQEALALDLGLLMDTSESMLEVLRLTQESAARFLETIPRAHELFTIFFDEDIRISRYDSEAQQGLFDRIFAQRSRGMTALYDAMTVYLSRIQGSPGRKVLVVFTDGEDTSSSVSYSELLKMLQSSPVTVYPIAIGATRSGGQKGIAVDAILGGMATATGGRVFRPMRAADVGDVYQTILEELSSQYVLGFAPNDPLANSKYHRLKVSTQRKGLRVRHRAGYALVPPG